MSSVFSKWMQWSCCRVGRSAKAETLSLLPQGALRRWSHTSDHQKSLLNILGFPVFSSDEQQSSRTSKPGFVTIKLDLFRETMPATNSPEANHVVRTLFQLRLWTKVQTRVFIYWLVLKMSSYGLHKCHFNVGYKYELQIKRMSVSNMQSEVITAYVNFSMASNS